MGSSCGGASDRAKDPTVAECARRLEGKFGVFVEAESGMTVVAPTDGTETLWEALDTVVVLAFAAAVAA
jgi:hypothetical protein